MPETLRRLFDATDPLVDEIRARAIQQEIAMQDPALTYSLESLPALLGRGDLILLKHALRNALGDPSEGTQRTNESDGDFLARMVRSAARYQFGKAA